MDRPAPRDCREATAAALATSSLQVPREFDAGHVYHLFPVLTEHRDAFQARMRERGVETLIHYPVPIPRQPALKSTSPAMCAIADRVCSQVVSLPMYPGLSDEAVSAVASAAAGFKPLDPAKTAGVIGTSEALYWLKHLMRHTLLIAALSFLVAAPAGAQQLKVSFDNGLVSVDATSVPVRQILNEWAKQGGTKVVGVERITGAPLTIKLIDVPESRALEMILRSVAGYMAAPARLRHWRIDVRPHSRDGDVGSCRPPPRLPPPSTAPLPNQACNGTQRFVPPRQQAAGRREQRKRTIRIRRIHRCSPSRSSRGQRDGPAGPVPEPAGQRRRSR